MTRLPHALRPSAAVVLACAAALGIARDRPAQQPVNPRNERFDACAIEYVSIQPRAQVSEIGDQPHPLPDERIITTVHLRNCSDEAISFIVRIGDDERFVSRGTVGPGATVAVPFDHVRDEAPFGRTVRVTRMADGSTAEHELDAAEIYGRDAMRIGLLVERKTFAAGNERFGSFVCRMRRCLEAMHKLLDDESATTGMEKRPVIRQRFRINDVQVYDREGLPELFWNHPQHDLVIACDEGGPLGGFYLSAYSIGHNFLHEGTGRGLWSRWGEQALWHELLHFRGVPDYYTYPIPKGALPGRTDERIDLPPRYAPDIMNDTYREDPCISALTAEVVNFKHGVSRVGACENPDNEFGHMWRWLPGRIVMEVTEAGRPLSGVAVRVYRGRSAGLADARIQGVAADRAPDQSLTLDEAGRGVIEDDYMGAAEPQRFDRSKWLLVEVARGDETRFAIIWGLWLNEQFANGSDDEVVKPLEWNEMRRAHAGRE